jgi:co-chaperonin GroES (HSP10)
MSIIDPMTAGNERPMTRTPLVGSAMSTMSQAPMPPWRNDDEADDYRNDPRGFLLDRCEMWMKACTVFHNWVITATYFLPDYLGESRKKGIILPDVTHDEALYQGKIGLVIGKGPLAFRDDEHVKFQGQDVEVGEWVQYDVMEGRQFTADRVHCRRLKDTQIVMRVPDPRLIY